MTNDLGISVLRTESCRIVYGESLAGLRVLLEDEKEVFVVYDRNVGWVSASVPGERMPVDTSEQAKSVDTVLEICNWLMEQNASRQALLVAVGGGITTDLVGFAASMYKRGIRYANVPTTLLAQVDAAIGGKTGVNFQGYKNMLGAFRMPEFTAICPEVLKTLPDRQFRAGLAEMLKTFIIADPQSYREAVSSGKSAKIPDGRLVARAAAIKAAIVERDPLEQGERAVLNLGHTFAHAIEHKALEKGDDILHGEAVAIGIIMAAEMAEREGVAEKGLAAQLRADFKALGLPTECPYGNLEGAMEKDKKAEGGKVTFVLPVAIGKVIMRSPGQARG